MDIIKLTVGASRTVVKAHKILLAYYSPVMKAALYGGFNETGQTEISLPEDWDVGIKFLVGWMETGFIDNVGVLRACDGATSKAGILAQLWVLGNKYLSLAFCNAVMQLLFDCLVEATHPDTVSYICDNTLPTSKLCSFLIDALQFSGPLSVAGYNAHEEAWLEFVGRGGENVKLLMRSGGLHNTTGPNPSEIENQNKYMEHVEEVPVEVWRT